MLEFFIGTKEQRAAPEKIKDLEKKPYLTRRQKEDLLDAKKLSRGLFGVRLRTAVIAATCLCLLGGFCTIHSSQKHDVLEGLPGWLTVQDVSKMGRVRAIEAASAAIDWDNKFECGRDVTISRLGNPEVKDFGTGFRVTDEERSEHGKIAIADGLNVRNIVLHAMTHACTPDNPTRISSLLISDGSITGYSGLKVEATLHSGEEKLFVLIEEGMAERNASTFVGYTVDNPGYSAIGSLTTQIFPLSADSQAHQLAKRNDVESFVRAKLSIPANSPVTGNNIEKVMVEYQETWDTAMKPFISSNPMSSFNL